MKIPDFLSTGLTRTSLAVTLGCLWLLDGLLQLQPRMFTPDFANLVLAQSGQGQPGWVSGPIDLLVKMVLSNPVAFGLGFAAVQLLLALLILWRRSRTVGLICSIVWALLVWVLGEGLGGALTGQSGLLTGFPGAALLYAVLAFAALPYPKVRRQTRPAQWLGIAWAAVWLAGAVYQLLPGQNSTYNLASSITRAASGAPGWLAAFNSRVAVMTSDCGIWLVLLLALVEVAVAIGVFMPEYIRKRAIYAGMLLAVLFWVIGQDMGGWYSGLATDPNSGPLFVVFGLAVLGCSRLITWPKDL